MIFQHLKQWPDPSLVIPTLGRCLMSLLVYVVGRFLVVIAKLVPSPVPTSFRNTFPRITAHLTYNHYTAGKGLPWMEPKYLIPDD